MIKFGITGKSGIDNLFSGECPYRGLEVFREEDSKFFFGREALVQQLHTRFETLVDNRFMAVLGPSGSGKSSVVQAGLVPILRREHAIIVLFAPGNDPVEELAFALRRLDTTRNVSELKQRLHTDKESLHLICRELTDDLKKQKIVLVVDQFEELFTITNDEKKVKTFIELLIYAVEIARGPTHVIITMRSDFLGKCASYPALNDYVTHHIEQAGVMNVQELRDAIEQPAWKAGLDFEGGLVEFLLIDVKKAPGKLPLLQFALKELYNKKSGNQLTFQAYQDMGGIEGALARRADAEYQKLTQEEQELLRKMFLRGLIQPGEGTEDTRRRASKQELYVSGEEAKVEKIIQQWSGQELRLLTVSSDNKQGDVVVEVAHEALIRQWDKIAIWMEESRE